MAGVSRRHSADVPIGNVGHCHRCQLDIDPDPRCDGRLRILCPFCGEFLARPHPPDIRQLKRDIEMRAADNNVEEEPSFRSRFSQTFNRMVLRRPVVNNRNHNGIGPSHRRGKTIVDVRMPAIVNKTQQTMENRTSAGPLIARPATPSIEIYDCESFKHLIDDDTNTEKILTFYSDFYSNFDYMIPTLTLNNDNKEINWKYLQIIHDYLIKDSNQLARLVLKAIASCCIREVRTCDVALKGYAIFLLTPIFDESSNYHIIAHIFRRIARLEDREHQVIVLLLKTLPVNMFRSTVSRIQTFVAGNLFPPRFPESTPSPVNGWWIPCAIRTLALFNSANEMGRTRIIPLEDMAIVALNRVVGERDYLQWKSRMTHSTMTGFTFCQYPFVLSVNAKRAILKCDSEQQMIVTARRSMIQKFQNKQTPNLAMLFLNLYIRRAHLVADSLIEIGQKRDDLKKKLRVTFVGENGYDMGGLTKEWFLLLQRQIFSPDYGMFVFYEESGVYWFNGASRENIREFNLVGVLMGLAVYNAIILDLRFPMVCYKKLLTPAFMPTQMANVKVGLIKPTLAHFRTIRPDITLSLQRLLDYDGNVEEDFGLTFEVAIGEFDMNMVYALKENGSKIDVTRDNRIEYVELLIDFYLNKYISKQFEAFYHGFHSVCSSNALLLLVPEELEMLICGVQQCDLSNLAKITKYENCRADEDLIRWFWQVVAEMSSDKQRRLLLFVTGSDRMPIGGVSEMTFTVAKMASTRSKILNLLPMSHTCFNQLLLPPYSTRELLKEKLFLAIENCEGFALSDIAFFVKHLFLT